MLAPGVRVHERYRILRLGERNPATSNYEAVDERFGSAVLVKEWLPGGSDASRAAFTREAVLLNRSFHPAFAAVVDTFSENGALYLVAQDPGGELLASKLDRRDKLAAATVLEWADRILDALDYLHGLEEPIVHAGVSPRAIRITPRGDAVLTDFSRAVESPSRPIGYVAPYAPYEQLQGQEIDARADVYGCAATLYHALSGEPPPTAFERRSARTSGRASELARLEEIAATAGATAASALERALMLEVDERTKTVAELRWALRGVVAIDEPLVVAIGTETTLDEEVAAETTLDEEVDTETTLDVDVGAETTLAVEAPGAVVRSVPPKAPTVATLAAPNAPTVNVVVPTNAPTDRVLEVPNAPTVALDPHVVVGDAALVAGVRPSSTSLICRTCGAANDPLRHFCPFCGSLLRSDRRPDDPPDAEAVAIAGDDPPTADLDDAPPNGAPLSPPKPLLAQLLVLEGEEPGRVLSLGGGQTDFGRAEGEYTFPLDIFMSGRHARIVRAGSRYGLLDVGSRNGTFLKIRGEVPLRPGDIILAGTQLLRYDPDGAEGVAYLRALLPTGGVGKSFLLDRQETLVGRTKGDITFPDDHSVADAHVRVLERNGAYYVADAGTKNGTFLRLNSEATLVDGDIVILGKHIFRFEISEWEDDYSTMKGY